MASARILVIDDDGDFRETVTAMLDAEGYQVVSAASGKEGLARLEVRPDLVICDVMMESIVEGYAVTLELKARDVPVIMVSAIAESPDQLFPRSEEVGAIRPDAYLTKPFEVPEFLSTVQRLLAQRAHA